MKGLYRLPPFLVLLLCISCGQGKKEAQKMEETPPVAADSIPPAPVPAAPPAYAPVDLSPMDMTYFPVDYPKLKMAKSIQTPPLARVIYSRPHLQGRNLFPEILKYGETWRLGANEATELQLFKSAKIQGRKINAGRYVLYCIPQPDKWTIMVSSNIDTWGLHPDTVKAVLSADIPVKQTGYTLEYFSMAFETTAKGADLLMGWDHTEARLEFEF